MKLRVTIVPSRGHAREEVFDFRGCHRGDLGGRYRWLTSLIFAAVLAILIWFYGTQLQIGTWHSFANASTRLFAVVAIGIGWLVYIGLKLFGARRADRKLMDAVTDSGKVDPQRAAAEDVAELRGRLRDALKVLRKSLGRDRLLEAAVRRGSAAEVAGELIDDALIAGAGDNVTALVVDSRQVNEILHHSRFQALESRWRGLDYLVAAADGIADVKIKIVSVSWKEVCRDLDKATEFDQSYLFDIVYNHEFGMPGGEPYGILLGDFRVCHG